MSIEPKFKIGDRVKIVSSNILVYRPNKYRVIDVGPINEHGIFYTIGNGFDKWVVAQSSLQRV